MGSCNSNKKKNIEKLKNNNKSNKRLIKIKKKKTIDYLDPNDSLLPINTTYSSRVVLNKGSEKNIFINRLTCSEKINTKKIVNLKKFEKAVFNKINQYRKRKIIGNKRNLTFENESKTSLENLEHSLNKNKKNLKKIQ